ncbi:hypothetical protein PIROE2DRAFT_18522 [Piromyces sp. E2]|nr:hypothetical protein PIROE2DRAFT_18522 [Piromyces sp. E2]|eukprot:OUM56739.1 hypothetical protein PIROE2DRAFT_18522 [Piromyces sp. E2]
MYFGFVFPESFEKKDEFLSNFKSHDIFKDNNIIVEDSFDFEKYLYKREVNEYDGNSDIFHNPINLKIIEQKILNVDVLLEANFNENYFNNDTEKSEKMVISNTLIQENDYYNLFPDYSKLESEYGKKYKEVDVISYNINKPPSYESKKNIHITTYNSQEDFPNDYVYGFFGIVFSSQTEYTIRKFTNSDITEFISPKYEKEYQSNEFAFSAIKSYAIVQNMIDQTLIKTLTNYDLNIKIYDKTMDQKEMLYLFEDNPANTYFPYLILFFFM